jgi:pimeloyl-ACP methyl ester carboxylesterase
MIGSAVLMSAAGFAPMNVGMVVRLTPHLLFKPTEEAARAMLAQLSPPDQPPDPFFLEWFELIMAHFRGEQNVPVLKDEEVRQLVAPSCLLLGQYEASFNPYRALERGLRLLPNLMVAEVVPGVGHSMVHPRPDWVVARVLRFLERYGVGC